MDLSEIRKKSKELKKAEKKEKQLKPDIEEKAFVAAEIPEVPEEVKVEDKGKTAEEEVKDKEAPVEPQSEEQIFQKDDSFDYLLFRIGNEDFAFDVNTVKEIIKLKEITDIPSSQKYILGIISLRGHMVPIVDLKKLLNLGSIDISKKTRIIVVSISEEEKFGLVVDSVDKVIDISDSTIEVPSVTLLSVENDYIKGVARKGGKLVTILDLEKILSTL